LLPTDDLKHSTCFFLARPYTLKHKAMEELGKAIKDMQEKLKQGYNDFESIKGLLHPTREIIDETMAELNLAGEQGILYLKRSIFDSLLTFIKNSRQARPHEKIFSGQRKVIRGLLLSVYVQRLISLGRISNTDENLTATQDKPRNEKDTSLVSIINEINMLSHNDKNTVKAGEIKRIVYFIEELKKAKQSFQVLTAHAKDGKKKDEYIKHYQRIVKNIERRIKTAYQAFKSNSTSQPADTIPLSTMPLKKLTPVLNVQMELLVKIFITLDFAFTQKGNVANIILPLAIDVKNLLNLVDREEVIYRSFFSDQSINAGQVKIMAGKVAVSFGSVIPIHLHKMSGM